MALWKKTAAVGALVLVVGVLYLLFPKSELCADEIRGFKKQASSSLGVIREKLESINGNLESGQQLEVEQLVGLDVTSFPALKACDIHCKLLSQCTRFRVFTPPSESCPTEYQDFKTATQNAIALLASLQGINDKIAQSEKLATDLGVVRADKEQLSKTLGSTGGVMSALVARERVLEETLVSSLQSIKDELKQSVPVIQ